MKNKKYYIIILLSLVLSFSLLLSSCNAISDKFIPGKSAYDIAVDNGFSGTEEEWLESLKGENGKDGLNGKDGSDSSIIEEMYNEAVKNGYTGSFFDFLKEYFSNQGSTENTYAYSTGLLSAVSVYCNFTKTVKYLTAFGIQTKTEEYTSAGSGVIYKDEKDKGNAYIITNYHVVFDTDSDSKISNNINICIYGKEYDEYKIPATYIGGSMTYDIAVIYIENSEIYKRSDCHAITVADSDNVYPGNTAIAIGNPEAEGLSITKGIVSIDSEYVSMTACDNVTTVTFRVMRIDTAVNPGNSGGGLFNGNGELIGIVNAKIISSEVESIAYAIPSNIAIGVAENIISNSEEKCVKKCLLGITLNIADSYAYYDKDLMQTKIINKISVAEIADDSPASNKLKVDDIIESVEFKGKNITVNRLYTLVDLSLYAKSGDTIVFHILRNNQPLTIEMTFADAIKIA